MRRVYITTGTWAAARKDYLSTLCIMLNVHEPQENISWSWWNILLIRDTTPLLSLSPWASSAMQSQEPTGTAFPWWRTELYYNAQDPNVKNPNGGPSPALGTGSAGNLISWRTLISYKGTFFPLPFRGMAMSYNSVPVLPFLDMILVSLGSGTNMSPVSQSLSSEQAYTHKSIMKV